MAGRSAPSVGRLTMMDVVLVFALLAVAAILFCLERVPVDAVALGVLVVLLTSGVLTPAEALAGFASEVVIVLAGIFVLTAGLKASGALETLGWWAQRLASASSRRSAAVLLPAVAVLSTVMNNTTTTAAFLPVAVGQARAVGLPPGSLLMPVAFASILGGSITLIGTSTNLIVSGLLPQFGEAPLGMFELAPVALPIAVAGIAYLILLGDRLLPAREENVGLAQSYHIRDYLSELVVERGSPLIGRTVGEAGFGKVWDLNLLAIARPEGLTLPGPDDRLRADDRLIVEGPLEILIGLEASRGLAIREPKPGSYSRVLHGQARRLVEAVVLPGSDLVGRTLKEFRFRQRFGAGVVALKRHGEPSLERLGRIRIRVGDVLLVLGEEPAIDQMLTLGGLLVVSQRSTPIRRRRAQRIAPITFGLAMLLATLGVMSLPAAVLGACLVLLATRCLTPQEAYAAIDWRVLVLIAGMLGYATAMAKTGAAALLADAVSGATGGLGPLALLAAFYLLTVVLTQPMSNQSAALVVLPIALGVAVEAGIDPRAMAVTVALAASNSFLTPLEPSCLLVYGPGRYRFLDFPRLGIGLTLLGLLLTLLLVPRFWPLGG